MLRLSDSWVWDFWLADTGEEYHLFFLRASRALGDPHRRHWRASVGHAVSTDLQDWTLLPDALVHSDGPAFDDMATWTGSVLQAPDGTWRMFYTGLTRSEGGQIQRIGSATSSDLTTWTPDPGMTPLSADARWYEKLGGSSWQGEAWRDPWVFADPGGDGWHMLVTARAVTGDDDDRGVIGHATSPDLQHWTVREPLSRPGAGFGQLEVLQVAEVEGHPVVLFSCLHGELSAASRERWASGGVWALPVDSVVGPFDALRRPAADRPPPVRRPAGPRPRRPLGPARLPPRRRPRRLRRRDQRPDAGPVAGAGRRHPAARARGRAAATGRRGRPGAAAAVPERGLTGPAGPAEVSRGQPP